MINDTIIPLVQVAAGKLWMPIPDGIVFITFTLEEWKTKKEEVVITFSLPVFTFFAFMLVYYIHIKE